MSQFARANEVEQSVMSKIGIDRHSKAHVLAGEGGRTRLRNGGGNVWIDWSGFLGRQKVLNSRYMQTHEKESWK